VGAMLALRGILQPLTERRAMGNLDQLSEGMRLSREPASADGQDPLLGVASKALH
jgi:hypothetical protein